MLLKKVMREILPPVVFDAMKAVKRALVYRQYLAKGGRPFGVGYSIYQKTYIGNVLYDDGLMACFARCEPVPDLWNTHSRSRKWMPGREVCVIRAQPSIMAF